jgi:GMP synthase (glutamine-hydrolysing)
LLKTTIAIIGGRSITDPEGARYSAAEDFDASEFVRAKIEEIQNFVGASKAAIATSGGVDSTACAALVHRVLGERLICLFMDTGFMREGEVEEVVTLLESMGLPLTVLRVKDRFMAALKGKTDAESKRLAFREAFYTILGEAVKGAGCEILVQGTIAPDWIETSGGIKTQHNVLEQLGVNTMDRFGFRLLEPLRDLYKDQVRAVARYLGVKEASERQPFPGPGLLVRCIGEVKEEKLDSLRRATTIIEKYLDGLDPPPKQYLAAIVEDNRSPAGEELGAALVKILPSGRAFYLKGLATGVKGDDRAYGRMLLISRVSREPKDLFGLPEKMIHADKRIVRVLYAIPGPLNKGDYIVIVRAVETRDFMTVRPSAIPLAILRSIALQVLKDPKVSAVTYDLTSKPPATVEFE